MTESMRVRNDYKIFLIILSIIFLVLFKYIIGPSLSNSRSDHKVEKIALTIADGLQQISVTDYSYYDDSLKIEYSIESSLINTKNTRALRDALNIHFVSSTCKYLSESNAPQDYTIVIVVRPLFEKYISLMSCN